MGDLPASSEHGHPRRDGDGYPDCPKCMGNGIVADPERPMEAATIPCPLCGGSKRGEYDHTITDDVRLGALLAGLTLGGKAIRDAVKQANPPTVERQPLDGEEHDGHWLTRKQVHDAVHAAAEVERIWREVSLRVARQFGSRRDPDGGAE